MAGLTALAFIGGFGGGDCKWQEKGSWVLSLLVGLNHRDLRGPHIVRAHVCVSLLLGNGGSLI